VVLLLIVTAALSLGGSMCRYKCERRECRFKGKVGLGGGFIFCKVTGYCPRCCRFVSIEWKRPNLQGDWKELADKSDLPDTPPEKVGSISNSATGRIANLYPCPTCKTSFVEIDEMSWEDMRMRVRRDESARLLCPRCSNLTFRVEEFLKYD